MLIVRFDHFKQTFRQRQMEWCLAFGSLAWGGLVLANPEAFDRPFYAPLKRIGSAETWGAVMLAVGILGLVALFINGFWKRTPLLRQIASVIRMLMWANLFFATISIEWSTPAMATYLMISIMEVMAQNNAASDRRAAPYGG